MAQVSVTVCDVCHAPYRPTEKWRLSRDGRSATFDLCREHAAPLGELFNGKTNRKQYRRFADAVTTMEDIEAMKRRPSG